MFIDDILVYSKIDQEHQLHLRKALTILRVSSRSVNFVLREVAFLGHVISEKGVPIDPAKVEAVTKWNCPTTVTEVRSFLGLAGYYQCFIKDFSKIAAHFTQLIQKTAFMVRRVRNKFSRSKG